MIKNEPFFQSLIEDCRDIVIESSFASRWSLVEGYHQLGSRILQDEDKLVSVSGGTSLRSALHDIAKLVGKRERSLYYAVEFVRMFPDINALPEGKDLNWYRIVHKYLTTESDKPKVLTKQDLRSILYQIKGFLKKEELRAVMAERSGVPLIPYEYPKLSEYLFYLQDNIEVLDKEG